jgi:hypothetical protein
MYHFINKLEAWACISHLAQEWYWRKFQSEIIITLIVYYIYASLIFVNVHIMH